jgi:hypothetical protein
MDLRGKEFKYPLADARGSVVLPNPKTAPKKRMRFIFSTE